MFTMKMTMLEPRSLAHPSLTVPHVICPVAIVSLGNATKHAHDGVVIETLIAVNCLTPSPVMSSTDHLTLHRVCIGHDFP